MLLHCGVKVERAARDCEVHGTRYPAGSFAVRCAQAFRPHILSMFEPQVHPDDFQFPGGPPIPPYDNAGWTPAFTMGIRFERILEGFSGPFEPVRELLPVPKPVSMNGRRPLRVALLDRYGGSMPSGWTRWIMEQFEIPFHVVYPPDIDRGGLSEGFDVLILVDGMTFGGGGGRGPGGPPEPAQAEAGTLGIGESHEDWLDAEVAGQGGLQNDPTVPPEWRARIGALTPERSLPRVREFLEAGGTVLAIGSATGIHRQLGLPIGDALTEVADGRERRLPREKFFIPGSVLRIRLDSAHPLTEGMPDAVDTMFDNSPAFKLLPGAESAGIRRIAWYDSDAPLRSGWAWGQAYLKDALAAVEAPVGKGRLLLFGPEILFRGQTHATFRFLFNAVLRPAT
jgi:hypothetical protein